MFRAMESTTTHEPPRAVLICNHSTLLSLTLIGWIRKIVSRSMSLFSVLGHLATPPPLLEHYDKQRAARTAHTAVCNGMAEKEVVYQVVGVSFKLQISKSGLPSSTVTVFGGSSVCTVTNTMDLLNFGLQFPLLLRGGGAGARAKV
jgi:hypothetical protein